jgi:hypothetical protein
MPVGSAGRFSFFNWNMSISAHSSFPREELRFKKGGVGTEHSGTAFL